MRVLLLGATGMIGQGALRECLRADDVEEVIALGRAPTGTQHPKLRDVVHADLFDLSGLGAELSRIDACLFCLGVSSAGMSEAQYVRLTHDLTLAVAEALLRHSPRAAFCFISGAGTDSSEQGRTMWARVKGRTENDLLRLPFAHAVMFRPGAIRPMHGEVSKTPSYRAMYAILGPLLAVVRPLAPGIVTTTEELGRALLQAARGKADKRVLESRDINALAATDGR